MIQEQVDRMSLGWSHERLARASGVTVAAVYLLERMGSAGSEDDARIRKSLAEGKAKNAMPHAGSDTYELEQKLSGKMFSFPTTERLASSDRKDVAETGKAGDWSSASPADMG